MLDPICGMTVNVKEAQAKGLTFDALVIDDGLRRWYAVPAPEA